MHAATESGAFLKAAVKLLQASVQSDVIFVLLHYYIQHGRSTEVWGSDGQTFTDDYLRQSIAANPHWHFLVEKPGMKLWPLSGNYASVQEMERCPYFRRYIVGHGMRHACGLLFWREDLTVVDCMLVPHRTAQRPDFSKEELALLEAVHAHIDTAYRRINRLENAASARRGLESFVAALPLPAILVDWELTPLFYNDSARAAAAHWTGADPHLKARATDFRVPEDLLAVVKEMRSEWTNALRTTPGSAKFSERTHAHPRLPGLRALLSMTPLRSPHFGKPSFLIRFEAEDHGAQDRLAALTRLSARECDLALLVCDGKSNQEIADSLGRNLNTVKSELHVVFKKLGIPSRARLMALLR